MILILMRIWIVASALSIGGISAAATEPIDETKIKTHRTRRLRRSSHVLNLDSVEQSKITEEQEAAIENINRIIGRSNDDEKPKRSNRDENRQLLHAGLISTMNVKLVDRQEEFLSNSKRPQVVQDEDLVWLMAHVSERRFQSSMPDKPTQRPVREPTRTPTPKPSRAPTYRPTIAPVPQTRPTTVPSGDPNPNTGPTPSRPTDAPVAGPAPRPTLRPTQPKPTLSPNADPNPGPAPVRQPTRNPTRSPTGPPVDEPTRPPTNRPTYQPTNQPTNQPIDRSTSPPTNGSPIYQDVSNAPTNPPVAAPDGSGPNPVPPSSVGETVCGGLTLEERQTLILGQLSTYSGREITITGTPQNLAYRWLIDEDAVQVCPEDFLNVQQRYILAVLYYATNGDRWFKCNALSAANPSQCLGGDSQRFLSSSDVCFWYGISCNRMRVSGISIDENNLRGELPDELGYMEQIEDLDFDGELEEGLNYLIGSIPTTLGLLEKLVTLDLDSNELTGTIPDEIFDADRLTIMDLDSNELTGTLNSKFMTLAELQILFLDNNGFFGTLPPEMGEMERLRFLRLDRNELSGSIPGAWEAMGKLRVLFLNNNGGITGTLPEYLGDFTDMQQLSLFDTGISGTVPSSLGELTGLVNLFLHFTDLTGTMPQEICDLRTSGALNFLTADCAGNNPKLRCSQPDCCTVCF